MRGVGGEGRERGCGGITPEVRAVLSGDGGWKGRQRGEGEGEGEVHRWGGVTLKVRGLQARGEGEGRGVGGGITLDVRGWGSCVWRVGLGGQRGGGGVMPGVCACQLFDCCETLRTPQRRTAGCRCLASESTPGPPNPKPYRHACRRLLPGAATQVPEMVPFRLTQNMVDSFGVSGVEGAYRKAAEMTMGVSHGRGLGLGHG